MSAAPDKIAAPHSPANDGSVRIRGLVKIYENERGHPAVTAVKGFDLDVQDGELMVLVGPSGCGKTTTLRLIAGLEQITSGTIEIGGRIVNEVQPKDRSVAMVFQNHALYPHMTVFDNMAFGLKVAKKRKEEIREAVLGAAAALGLEKLLDRKPQALSGGQRQRVALGRAIVRCPRVFLLDEPLSNLDAQMRVQMRSEITRLHARLRTTMIYVTHDQMEAMTLGDRICVMRDGVNMQTADPRTLYRHPANLFVASFVGTPPMNLLAGRIQRRGGALTFVEDGEPGGLVIPLEGRLEGCVRPYLEKRVVLGIRPEHLTGATKGRPGVSATFAIEFVEQTGAETFIYLKAGARSLTARVYGEHLYRPGETFTVHLNLEHAHLFDAEAGNVINEK